MGEGLCRPINRSAGHRTKIYSSEWLRPTRSASGRNSGRSSPRTSGPICRPRPVMIDLGCGPGLFLRDLGGRHPGATLYGYDVTPAMVAYGRQLVYGGAKATLALPDVATQPPPHPAGQLHLGRMSSVLPVFDEPLPALGGIRRALGPR